MKKLLFTTFLLFIVARGTSFADHAQIWASQVTQLSNEKETQALLNLLYWSYRRSATTLMAQKAFLTDQQLVTQAIYSITSTRLNPAYKQPYTIDPEHLKKMRQHFIDAQQEHQCVGKMYSECIETIIHGNLLSSAVYDLALQVRDGARTVIAHQLSTHLGQIDHHLATLQDSLKESYQLFQKIQATRKVGDLFFHYLWDLLPALAVKSFVRFDNQLTDINHQLWHALLKSEEFGNYRWCIIEEKRAEFYATYYNALYQHLQHTTMSSAAFFLLFDTPSIMLPASLPVHVQ